MGSKSITRAISSCRRKSACSPRPRGSVRRRGARDPAGDGGGSTIDLIDAHYLYPDGVAAVALGRAFGKPVVVTARGSDVTQYPDHAGSRGG